MAAGLIVFALFVVVPLLSLVGAVDSRKSSAQGWWPGTPKQSASQGTRDADRGSVVVHALHER